MRTSESWAENVRRKHSCKQASISQPWKTEELRQELAKISQQIMDLAHATTPSVFAPLHAFQLSTLKQARISLLAELALRKVNELPKR